MQTTTYTATHSFQTAPDAIRYMCAGNAKVTLSSTSGKHFTYKIRKAKDKPGQDFPTYFVSALGGDGFEYLGFIKGIELHAGRKGCPDAPAFKAFSWAFTDMFQRAEIHPKLTIRHEGSCGRCGRTLTHPDSIDNGIGPECSKYMAA